MAFTLDLVLTTLSKTLKQAGILVLSIVLARYLSQTDYGTYLHVQLIANVCIWSFMLGIPHSIYYFLPKVKQKSRLLLTTIGNVVTIATLVSLCIFVFGGFLKDLLNNPNLETLMIITALITGFQIPLSIFEPTLIASNKVKQFIINDSLFNIGFFLAILVPTLLTANIEVILTCLCVFQGVQLIAVLAQLLALTWSQQDSAEGVDYRLSDQLQYALPIGLSQGVFELARYGDKVIVSHFFDPATLAVYTRGAMDIPLLNIVNNTIDNLMMPKLMEAYKDQCAQSLLKLWHDTIALTASFMYPSFFFLVFTAPYLIPGLYGDAYQAAVPIFQIYTCGILFRVTTYNVIVRVIGKTGLMAWVAIVAESSNLIATWILVKTFGLWGAPFATVMATGLIVIGYLFGIAHRLNISITQVFPWKRLFSIAALAALALLPLAPVQWSINEHLIEVGYWGALGLMAPLYTLTYWFLMRTLPALAPHQRDLLRQSLPQPLKKLV